MIRIWGDIPKCLNQLNDIQIFGTTLEEHNETPEKVLQCASDFGITLNREKCHFGVNELELYGYKFTSDGLKPKPEKVRAVKECTPPRTREEVRSFLGMIGYLSKFIPQYAILIAPFRRLTGQGVVFTWGDEEDQAFRELKDSITNDDTIAYFDPKRPIIVRTVASFNEGMSAGPFQRTSKGLQPGHYISRSMTVCCRTKIQPDRERRISCEMDEKQI